MNWIFGKPKSDLPELTALQIQRLKQIEQLKTFNQNVTEIQRDVEYRVNTLVHGSVISLHISLPSQFPQEKPVVRVYPAVRHSWVNDQMIVTGCAGLNTFIVHSNLGKVIKEIMDEFQRNPPMLIHPAYTYTPNMVNPMQTYRPTMGVGTNNLPQQQQQQQPYTPYSTHTSVPNYMQSYQMPTLPGSSLMSLSSFNTATTSVAGVETVEHNTVSDGWLRSDNDIPENWLAQAKTVLPEILEPATDSQLPSGVPGMYRMPDLPQVFPQLEGMSVDELQSLAKDEDDMLRVIKDLPQIKIVAQDRQKLCSQLRQQAEENLSKKPLFEDSKRTVLEKYESLHDTKRQFDEKCAKQDDLSEKNSYSNIMLRLQIAIAEAEEESEVIADDFLNGQMGLNDFLQKYMNNRSLCHLRKAKEERLQCTMQPDHSAF